MKIRMEVKKDQVGGMKTRVDVRRSWRRI